MILITLGSTQSISKGEMTYLRKCDRSTAPPRSSPLATFSTGCNTWIAPTDRGLVVEESETEEEDVDKDEDEKEEGRTGRGEWRVEEEEEEEVGRDKEDMTNLKKVKTQKLRRMRIIRVSEKMYE